MIPKRRSPVVPVRPFRSDDAEDLARLSAASARGESDFVLNPYWETKSELLAEFDRFGIAPERHLLVFESEDEPAVGMVGFLRNPDAPDAGLFCPIVIRRERGRGHGGELLRAALRLGKDELGIKVVAAGIGTRNRAGYALLTSYGFRPVRQHFLMRCDTKPAVARPPIEGVDFDAAKPDDAEAILEVYTACGFEGRSLERQRALLTDGQHAHTIARHGRRVVAFVELEMHWPRRNWVAYVGVTSELRDRGLGSALVAWALDRQFSGPTETALLLLSPANRTALRAYEKVGFRRHRLVDVLEKRL